MPAKPLNSFQAFALEQLQRAQATTAKRMFGASGSITPAASSP
jgi:hypothetical protein